MVESLRFEAAIGALIVVNAIVSGVDAMYKSGEERPGHGSTRLSMASMAAFARECVVKSSKPLAAIQSCKAALQKAKCAKCEP